MLEIDLPPVAAPEPELESPARQPGEFETIEVTVPAGAKPGETFTVKGSSGSSFEVEVPRGTVPGSTLFVEVAKEPGTPKGAPPGTPAPKPALSLHVEAHRLHSEISDV